MYLAWRPYTLVETCCKNTKSKFCWRF